MGRVNNLRQAIDYLKYIKAVRNDVDCAAKIGIARETLSRYISKGAPAVFLSKFNETFDFIFNERWLKTGVGQMLAASEEPQGNNIIQGNGISHVQQVNGQSTAMTCPASTSNSTNEDSDTDFERAPIIPQNWAKRPNFDTYEAVQENLDKVELSDVVVADLPISAWHRVTSNCMYPYCFAGDKVALTEIPDKKTIIPGDIYGIDTRSNGMIIRILFPIEGGFRAHAYNSTEYPDFVIPHTDVIRVFRKVGLFRI